MEVTHGHQRRHLVEQLIPVLFAAIVQAISPDVAWIAQINALRVKQSLYVHTAHLPTIHRASTPFATWATSNSAYGKGLHLEQL